jgi:hypothetical protein
VIGYSGIIIMTVITPRLIVGLAIISCALAQPRGYDAARNLQYTKPPKQMMGMTQAPSISAQPTISPAPSYSPTVSSAPSSSPSDIPTGTPSKLPSTVPTSQPSVTPPTVPTHSQHLATYGFDVVQDANRTTLTTACPATSPSSSSTFDQVFHFQYLLYTNANAHDKIRAIDGRYLQALGQEFLACSHMLEYGAYNFTADSLVAKLSNMTDVITSCPAATNGTHCFVGTGSFAGQFATTSTTTSTNTTGGQRLRQLTGSDPILIAAFGSFLQTLFAGPDLLDEAISSLAFEGFTNPITNDDLTGSSHVGSYAGLQQQGGSNSRRGSTIPIAASVGAVALVLVLLTVMQRRKRRKVLDGEDFLDLDSQAAGWGHEKKKPSDRTTVDTIDKLKALEASIEPEFDFEVDGVNHLVDESVADLSDDDNDMQSTITSLSYTDLAWKRSKRSSCEVDCRSELTPNTVDL